jgi:cobaltochelatase CobS
MSEAAKTITSADKIKCEVDGALVHSIQAHLRANYPSEWTLERYREVYPEAPLLSEFARKALDKAKMEKEEAEKRAREMASQAGNETGQPQLQAAYQITAQPMHEVFELGNVPAAIGSAGQPIPVQVFAGHNGDSLNYLVEADKSYVFNIELLKKVLVAFALNKPLYLWGMHGTGKTTVIQQAAARTRRPVMRVQHTINMEESHVLGQWVVKNGQTEFQLGPLPMAMINGWVYIADEYDFAMPSVTAVYQPVLEGQSLLIKDAPPHLRKIIPHPDFRFAATGNTNGCGDETGLYQGTLMQNAANFSRFGITEEVEYMDAAIEENILRSKANVPAPVAKKIVKLANDVRKMFRDGKIGMTISPREMIAAAEVGIAFGGNWKLGIELSFANRLPRADKKAVQEYLQRHFA